MSLRHPVRHVCIYINIVTSGVSFMEITKYTCSDFHMKNVVIFKQTKRQLDVRHVCKCINMVTSGISFMPISKYVCSNIQYVKVYLCKYQNM